MLGRGSRHPITEMKVLRIHTACNKGIWRCRIDQLLKITYLIIRWGLSFERPCLSQLSSSEEPDASSESMACGRPVITTNVGISEEVVKDEKMGGQSPGRLMTWSKLSKNVGWKFRIYRWWVWSHFNLLKNVHLTGARCITNCYLTLYTIVERDAHLASNVKVLLTGGSGSLAAILLRDFWTEEMQSQV